MDMPHVETLWNITTSSTTTMNPHHLNLKAAGASDT
jgi:hypothetical protein